MFYKNLKTYQTSVEKDLVFSVFDDGVTSSEDDSVAKSNTCKDIHNFMQKDGALKTGLGFKELEVPYNSTDLDTLHTFDLSDISEILSIDFFRFMNTSDGQDYYQLFLVDGDGQLWYCVLIDTTFDTPFLKTSAYDLSNVISSTSYRIGDYDCVLYFTNSGMLYASAYAVEFNENVPALISCGVHYDKFFGITNTNRNELIYTTDLNLREWTEKPTTYLEFLDQRGAFTKLVAFNDYVYLFREFGITKISEYGTSDDFTFTHIYTSASRIYENSICVCGENVYFMSRDGLFAFNGSTVSKICENYDKYFQNLDNLNCTSCCLDGKYYIATKYDFSDDEEIGCEEEEYVNNVLFQVDVNTEEVEILRGVDIKKIIKIDLPQYSRVAACFNNSNSSHLGQLGYYGCVFDVVMPKEWKSYSTDLGYQGKKKKIKEILLTTENDCTFEIVSDYETKTFDFSGMTDEQRLSCSCYGNTFQFILKSTTADCKISKPKIVFDVVI